jgi:quinol monooxygenase YgiN
MDKGGMLVLFHAKAGKEREVEKFLKSVLPLANNEVGTTAFYAFRLGPARFGIFDTFRNEEARKAHLNGKLVDAFFAALELAEPDPKVERLEILAAKGPGAGRLTSNHSSVASSSRHSSAEKSASGRSHSRRALWMTPIEKPARRSGARST